MTPWQEILALRSSSLKLYSSTQLHQPRFLVGTGKRSKCPRSCEVFDFDAFISVENALCISQVNLLNRLNVQVKASKTDGEAKPTEAWKIPIRIYSLHLKKFSYKISFLEKIKIPELTLFIFTGILFFFNYSPRITKQNLSLENTQKPKANN